MKKRRGRRELLVAAVALVAGGAALLFHLGFVRFNYPSHLAYPVRGFDVSHHQGRIDWARVAGPEAAFVFIKATEGATHKDTEFPANWDAAGRAGIVRGAYHYFTFCGSGLAQAENFIAAVPPSPDMLPPAVDVEYSDQCAAPPPIETIRSELAVLVSRLEQVYACKAILYVTRESERDFVAGRFEGHPIWARNVWWRPRLSGGRRWTFWQFADHGRLEGIDGRVDLNLFAGSHKTLEGLLLPIPPAAAPLP